MERKKPIHLVFKAIESAREVYDYTFLHVGCFDICNRLRNNVCQNFLNYLIAAHEVRENVIGSPILWRGV
jgi:hypothetical protein